MHDKCPNCGYMPEGPRHDACRNTVTFRGQTAHVTHAGNLIMDIFMRRHPNTVHRDVLINSIWGGLNEVGDPESNFRVQCHHLKAALKPLGISIKNSSGRGFIGFYWLDWDA